MITITINKTLTSRLGEITQRDFRLAVRVLVLVAALNAGWTCWKLYEFYQMVYEAQRENLEVFINSQFIRMDVRIASALIISAACLWSNKFTGLCFSTIALLWCEFEYLRWYQWSQGLLENLSDKHFPEGVSHTLNLYGATWWDAVVLIMTLALLIWEIKTLAAVFFWFCRSRVAKNYSSLQRY